MACCRAKSTCIVKFQEKELINLNITMRKANFSHSHVILKISSVKPFMYPVDKVDSRLTETDLTAVSPLNEVNCLTVVHTLHIIYHQRQNYVFKYRVATNSAMTHVRRVRVMLFCRYTSLLHCTAKRQAVTPQLNAHPCWSFTVADL
jgi:uncharacterized protein YhhL (DUF1145 family)